MEEKFVIVLEGISTDRIPNRDNAARIPNIASQEQFKHFADEVVPLIGGTKMENNLGKNVLGIFLSMDLFIYPVAFRVGFRVALHSIIAKLLKQFNVSP